MATVNSANIYLGSPNQATTGAIFSAATSTTLPTDAITALAAGFTSSGYVSEGGVNISWDRAVTNLFDWSKKTVRSIVGETTAEISFEMLEISEESAKQVFGDSAVTVTAATASHGKQLSIAIDGSMPEAKAWVINIKDGDRRIRLLAPNARVTSLPDMSFVADAAVVLPVTITCYPNSSGLVLDVFTDDGVTS